jgi:DNA-binding MarR family transcriptional regulator
MVCAMPPQPLVLLLAQLGLDLHRTLERHFGATQLTATQYRILRALADGGSTHARQLARRINQCRQTVWFACGPLAHRGLIVRSARYRDARLVVLAITESGEAILEQLEPAVRRLDALLNLRLKPPARHLLHATVTRAADNMLLRRFVEDSLLD